jgi:membrane-associated protein
MELIHWLIDFILHLDEHLVEMLRDYGFWVYLILFLIVFAETGLVVTPFLPGDSLLFAAGALAAVDSSNTLSPVFLSISLIVAAILGNTTNYHIGKWIGPPAFSGRIRFLKVEYLQRTEAFFVKYGAMAIVISRFAPILRTCAPFVAGVARMPYGRFQTYNFLGGICWVLSFVWLGYFFGNLPIIKDNFGLVTIGIVIVSLLPVIVMALKKPPPVPPVA